MTGTAAAPWSSSAGGGRRSATWHRGGRPRPGRGPHPRSGQAGGQVGLLASRSAARSRMRRGSTSTIRASLPSRSGRSGPDRIAPVVGQPGQPGLHAVEELAVGQALPLLAAPRLGRSSSAARRRTSSSGSSSRAGEDLDRRPGRRSTAGRSPRSRTADRPRRPTGRCAPGRRRWTGTRRRSTPGRPARPGARPGTRAGSRRPRGARPARRGRPDGAGGDHDRLDVLDLRAEPLRPAPAPERRPRLWGARSGLAEAPQRRAAAGPSSRPTG